VIEHKGMGGDAERFSTVMIAEQSKCELEDVVIREHLDIQ